MNVRVPVPRWPEVNTAFNETVREYQRRGYLFGSAVMMARIDFGVPVPPGWMLQTRLAGG